MSWIAISIGGSAILQTGASTGWKFGMGGKNEDDLPNFQEDPYVGKTQEALYPFGADILKGDVGNKKRVLDINI